MLVYRAYIILSNIGYPLFRKYKADRQLTYCPTAVQLHLVKCCDGHAPVQAGPVLSPVPGPACDPCWVLNKAAS